MISQYSRFIHVQSLENNLGNTHPFDQMLGMSLLEVPKRQYYAACVLSGRNMRLGIDYTCIVIIRASKLMKLSEPIPS